MAYDNTAAICCLDELRYYECLNVELTILLMAGCDTRSQFSRPVPA